MIAGTGRRQALTEVSERLHEQLAALKGMNTPCGDTDVRWAMLFLEDAIDRVDLAATAAFDMRVPA